MAFCRVLPAKITCGPYRCPSSPIAASSDVCSRAAVISLRHGSPTGAITFDRPPVPCHGFGHSSEFNTRRASRIDPSSAITPARTRVARNWAKCLSDTALSRVTSKEVDEPSLLRSACLQDLFRIPVERHVVAPSVENRPQRQDLHHTLAQLAAVNALAVRVHLAAVLDDVLQLGRRQRVVLGIHVRVVHGSCEAPRQRVLEDQRPALVTVGAEQDLGGVRRTLLRAARPHPCHRLLVLRGLLLSLLLSLCRIRLGLRALDTLVQDLRSRRKRARQQPGDPPPHWAGRRTGMGGRMQPCTARRRLDWTDWG
eukprot:7377721-Prymnesium_polylepis.1